LSYFVAITEPRCDALHQIRGLHAASCRLARMMGDAYLRGTEKQPKEAQTL
jgi:hypothetical protein